MALHSSPPTTCNELSPCLAGPSSHPLLFPDGGIWGHPALPMVTRGAGCDPHTGLDHPSFPCTVFP